MDLVQQVYRVTMKFPDHEKYGITNQMRRASVSVPSNIAEGQGRGSPRDFRRFLALARGSLFELETQILLSEGLQYLPVEDAKPLYAQIEEVGKLLNGLMKSLPVDPK